MQGVRLGKKAAVRDPRTLMLADYLTPSALPAAPDVYRADLQTLGPPPVPVFGLPDWGMLANDSHGDCTAAGVAHMRQLWTALAGKPRVYTNDEVLALYARVNGGHDDGAVELFVLNEIRHNGITGPDDRIEAFAGVNPANRLEVQQAVYLTDGLYIGVALPLTAQGAAEWDVVAPMNAPVAQPGSWGGHCVDPVGYDTDFLYFVSWGRVMRMSWAFWHQYVDEAWVVLPLLADFKSKNLPGIDYAALEADLSGFGPINPAN